MSKRIQSEPGEMVLLRLKALSLIEQWMIQDQKGTYKHNETLPISNMFGSRNLDSNINLNIEHEV